MTTYKRPLVEHLLPAVWDQSYAFGMENPLSPDPDMPKAKPDPKVGGTIYAHLADIRRAWSRAEVPQVERQALLLHYALGWTDAEIGKHGGCGKSTICERRERGVGRLAAFLNGVPFDSDNYEIDTVD